MGFDVRRHRGGFRVRQLTQPPHGAKGDTMKTLIITTAIAAFTLTSFATIDAMCFDLELARVAGFQTMATAYSFTFGGVVAIAAQ